MRTADVVELESTDGRPCDVPLAALVVVVQPDELGRVGQVHFEARVRPRPEYHRTFLRTRTPHSTRLSGVNGLFNSDVSSYSVDRLDANVISDAAANLSVVRIERDVDFAGSLEDAGRLPQHLPSGRYDGAVPREIRELVLDPNSPTNINTHTHTHTQSNT